MSTARPLPPGPHSALQALQIPKEERAQEITGLVGSVLAKLEKDRSVLQLRCWVGRDYHTLCVPMGGMSTVVTGARAAQAPRVTRLLSPHAATHCNGWGQLLLLPSPCSKDDALYCENFALTVFSRAGGSSLV